MTRGGPDAIGRCTTSGNSSRLHTLRPSPAPPAIEREVGHASIHHLTSSFDAYILATSNNNRINNYQTQSPISNLEICQNNPNPHQLPRSPQPPHLPPPKPPTPPPTPRTQNTTPPPSTAPAAHNTKTSPPPTTSRSAMPRAASRRSTPARWRRTA